MIKPYPDQIKWMNDLRDVLVAGGSPLGQAATGFGKTICYALMARVFAKAGKSTMIMVHRQELIWQTVLALSEVGIPAGVIAPASLQTLVISRAAGSGFILNQRSPVQVASIDTIHSYIKRGREPVITDFLFIDEAHHSMAPTWRLVINYYRLKGVRLIGATATPERNSGEGLSTNSGGFFTRLVMGPPMEELVANGRIAEPIIYYPKKHFEKSHIRLKDGEYVAGDIERESNTITGSILQHYKKYFDGKPVLTFCANLQHCQYMRKVYKQEGWKAEIVDGTMKERIRADRIAAIGEGRINVLISCNLIGEGLDVPAVAGAQLLRLTTSRTLLYQQIGRTLRIGEDKDKGIILDHAGNFSDPRTMAHPYEATSASDWNFHGQEKEKREPGTPSHIICSGCRAIYSSRMRKCPQCQKEREMNVEIPKEVSGELVKYELPEHLIQWSRDTGWEY